MVNVSNNQSFGLQQPWNEFLTFLAMIEAYFGQNLTTMK